MLNSLKPEVIIPTLQASGDPKLTFVDRKVEEKDADQAHNDSMIFSDRKNLDDYVIGKQIG
jgi:hypothetical protein